MIANAKKPIFYTGGGVINSGPCDASRLLRDFVRDDWISGDIDTDGAGRLPGIRQIHSWLGMLGMHGTYEANNAMHDCDVMINIGARFDDRITGRIDAFSPEFKEDSRGYRSVVNQQEHPCRHSRSSAIVPMFWRT